MSNNLKTNSTIMVTGGAGFIGSNFIIEWMKLHQGIVLNLDLLTYAGNIQNLDSIKDNPNHIFVKGNICDQALISKLLNDYSPTAIINFAAESHVDRSIKESKNFISTNINGVYYLLEAALNYWCTLDQNAKANFRLLHISTDEVYGSLEPNEPAFTENNKYKPSSPYSASKAASDHLVRAWNHTYGLPTLITNCSNNYGPYQFPEKLIPLTIMNALVKKTVSIYGDGKNIRDWLFVTDHCAAIRAVLSQGLVGNTYNIGGYNEKDNIEVVNLICDLLNEMVPLQKGEQHPITKAPLLSYNELITFVEDRPGHDRRYAINPSKIEKELHWKPQETFDTGIKKTIKWYIDNYHFG